MTQYDVSPTAPHLRVTLNDTLSHTEVERTLASLPDDLAALPSSFVAYVAYENLVRIDDATAQVLYYSVTHLFDANPGLCVFVDGGHSPHPGLRNYIKKLGHDDQVLFVRTRDEAEWHIEQFAASCSTPPPGSSS